MTVPTGDCSDRAYDGRNENGNGNGATPGGEPTFALRRPRDDALPEFTRYRDHGCDLFASCLECPLPRCRYDVPGGARAVMNGTRDAEIRRLRHHLGTPVDEIARRFRVSRRTVFRVLQKGPRPAPAAAQYDGCDGREPGNGGYP